MRKGRNPNHFLRAWRKARSLKQREVVDKIAELDCGFTYTHASLSRVESGEMPYSQPLLEALSKIYDVRPGDLLDKDPLDVPCPSCREKDKQKRDWLYRIMTPAFDAAGPLPR